MSALKAPPSTPPTDIRRKNSVSWIGGGRSRASSPWQARAVTKNTTRWKSITSANGESAFPASITTNGKSRSGNVVSTQRCGTGGRAAKTRMKVSRYRVRGIIHSSGTAATSVVMYIVTLSIRLDGTNASRTHRSRRPAETFGSGTVATEFVFTSGSSRWRRPEIHNNALQPKISASNST